ncbi:MAG: hypothetical protein EXR78_05090 [Deltaproteobacteria bacterium]|nr:hypothetical protein [Deltaproteobacteria bacterium]
MAVALDARAPEVADQLIARALDKQYAHQDNLTAVVMTWEADDTTPLPPLVPPESAVRVSRRMLIGVAFLLVLLIGIVLGYWQAKHGATRDGARETTGVNMAASPVPRGDAISNK